MGEIGALFEKEELEILGVTGSDPLPEDEARFAEWIASGFHGTMGFLEKHSAKKFKPRQLLPGCRSLIFTALGYYQPRGKILADHGLVARYAWGRDYHKVLGKRLKRITGNLREMFPEDRFLPFVDTSPLAERPFASRAGVGFVGRSTLLIREGYGSWFVLGGIASTFDPDAVLSGKKEPAVVAGAGCPPGCSLCIDACPTGALFAPYKIDARKCISYLTIEHKLAIPAQRASSIGNRLFGCDACQEACPFNHSVEKTYVADFLSPLAGESLSIKEVLSINTAAEYSRRFAGSPLMRAKRAGLVRNACVCAENLGLVNLRPRLKGLIDDEDPVIGKQAALAAKKLS